MLSEKQIKSLLQTISAKLKKSGYSFAKHDGKCSHIDWSDGYRDAADFAEQVEVHSVIGKFPEKLMIAKAPNETPEELKYRKEIFESITVPYWHRAENSINRIWAEQNYKIDYGSDESKDYFTKEYPIYKNLISYFQSVVTKEKIRDPNTVLALDFDLPLKEQGEGEIVIDQSVALEPYASLYDADNVLMYEDGDLALFACDEKSPVVYGHNKQELKGFVFYLYDDTNIYRIAQTGKYIDYTFEIVVYYPHALGYLPCWKLKGIPYEVYADNPVYQSYFIGAIPHLNTALKNSSTLDLSINKVAYPTRVYYESKCTNSKCDGGKIYTQGENPKDCSTCGGSGKMKFSPARDFIQEAPTRLDSDAFQMPFPALQYVAPDTGILEFNKTKIKEDIVEAFTFINIDITNDATANGTTTTATEIRIDRDEFYSFLLNISAELFSLLENFIDAANAVRYKEEITVVVSPPKSFDLITPKELTEELATENLPAIARQELNREYLVNRFTQHSNLAKIGELIDIIDPYSYKTTVEIISLVSAGIAPKWKAILHEEILSYIADELDKDEKFLEKDTEVIKTVLYDKAKAEAAAMATANTASNILNQIGNGGAV